jgi:hypothetical protein
MHQDILQIVSITTVRVMSLLKELKKESALQRIVTSFQIGFQRKCFIGNFDEFRYNGIYIKLMKNFQIDSRIRNFDNLIKYMNRKVI